MGRILWERRLFSFLGYINISVQISQFFLVFVLLCQLFCKLCKQDHLTVSGISSFFLFRNPPDWSPGIYEISRTPFITGTRDRPADCPASGRHAGAIFYKPYSGDGALKKFFRSSKDVSEPCSRTTALFLFEKKGGMIGGRKSIRK